MIKTGPIVVVEDDADDQELLRDVFAELNYPNEVIFFSTGSTAYEYFEKTECKIFIILSDINLPGLNGYELRDKIYRQGHLKLKCIPFIYFSTSAQRDHVIDVYSRSVQGFFKKPSSYAELLRVVRNIIEYWKDSISPDDAT